MESRDALARECERLKENDKNMRWLIKEIIEARKDVVAENDHLRALLPRVAKAVLSADTEANGPMLRSVGEILEGCARFHTADSGLIREVCTRFNAWVRERARGKTDIDVQAIITEGQAARGEGE
jgi:hypothetical protein